MMTNDEFLASFRDLSDAERLDQAEQAVHEISEVLDDAETTENARRNVRSVDFLAGAVFGLLAVTEGRELAS